MNFFKRMSELIEGYTVQITIKKEGDQLIVLMVPKLDVKKDEVQNEIVPLSLKGSAEQLDDAFWATVSEGLRQTTELQSNLSAYQDGLNKAGKKVEPPKTGKGKTDKKTEEKKAGLFGKNKDKDTKKTDVKDKSEKKEEVDISQVDKATGEIKEEPKVETPVAAATSEETTESAVPALEDKTDEPVTDTESNKAETGTSNSAGKDEFQDDEW